MRGLSAAVLALRAACACGFGHFPEPESTESCIVEFYDLGIGAADAVWGCPTSLCAPYHANTIRYILSYSDEDCPSWFSGECELDPTMDSPEACQVLCQQDDNCQTFTYDTDAEGYHECMLRDMGDESCRCEFSAYNNGGLPFASGPKNCGDCDGIATYCGNEPSPAPSAGGVSVQVAVFVESTLRGKRPSVRVLCRIVADEHRDVLRDTVVTEAFRVSCAIEGFGG